MVSQLRDNVLVEFGLFRGGLGEGKVIFCRRGKPKFATDIAGVTWVDISDSSLARASLEIQEWLDRIQQPDPTSILTKQMARLESPFQASGKETLFLRCTELISS